MSEVDSALHAIRVHSDGRMLCTARDTPFFWLADTAWELVHRLNAQDAERYFATRAAQGFNVVQTVLLAEQDGLGTPNAYGRLPLKDWSADAFVPDDDGGDSYWAHARHLVWRAAAHGLYTALLPFWGDKFCQKHGVGPPLLTPGNTYGYARWLAGIWGGCSHVVWVLGGDRPLETSLHREIIDAAAAGLRDGGAQQLITFHPPGAQSSVDFLADAAYLDFHAVQSSHGAQGCENHRLVRRTLDAAHWPCLDMEPRYEDHPAFFNPQSGWRWTDAEVRQNLYWSLMEGACGHSYGSHGVWCFNTEKSLDCPITWQEGLERPGAAQVRHGKALRLSRPYFEFRPAPGLCAEEPAANGHIAAGRGDGYAFVYTPLGLPVRVFAQQMGGGPLRASWFDVRTGRETAFGGCLPQETLFVPPSSGHGQDWVLILDVIDAPV